MVAYLHGKFTWTAWSWGVNARRKRTFWGRVIPPKASEESTLIISDIQNSTNLWEKLEEHVMDVAISAHHACFRAHIDAFSGYEAAVEGDSFCVAFHNANDAAMFSIQIQEALLYVQWPTPLLELEECRAVYVSHIKPERLMSAQPHHSMHFSQYQDAGDSHVTDALSERCTNLMSQHTPAAAAAATISTLDADVAALELPGSAYGAVIVEDAAAEEKAAAEDGQGKRGESSVARAPEALLEQHRSSNGAELHTTDSGEASSSMRAMHDVQKMDAGTIIMRTAPSIWGSTEQPPAPQHADHGMPFRRPAQASRSFCSPETSRHYQRSVSGATLSGHALRRSTSPRGVCHGNIQRTTSGSTGSSGLDPPPSQTGASPGAEAGRQLHLQTSLRSGRRSLLAPPEVHEEEMKRNAAMQPPGSGSGSGSASASAALLTSPHRSVGSASASPRALPSPSNSKRSPSPSPNVSFSAHPKSSAGASACDSDRRGQSQAGNATLQGTEPSPMSFAVAAAAGRSVDGHDRLVARSALRCSSMKDTGRARQASQLSWADLSAGMLQEQLSAPQMHITDTTGLCADSKQAEEASTTSNNVEQSAAAGMPNGAATMSDVSACENANDLEACAAQHAQHALHEVEDKASSDRAMVSGMSGKLLDDRTSSSVPRSSVTTTLPFGSTQTLKHASSNSSVLNAGCIAGTSWSHLPVFAQQVSTVSTNTGDATSATDIECEITGHILAFNPDRAVARTAPQLLTTNSSDAHRSMVKCPSELQKPGAGIYVGGSAIGTVAASMASQHSSACAAEHHSTASASQSSAVNVTYAGTIMSQLKFIDSVTDEDVRAAHASVSQPWHTDAGNQRRVASVTHSEISLFHRSLTCLGSETSAEEHDALVPDTGSRKSDLKAESNIDKHRAPDHGKGTNSDRPGRPVLGTLGLVRACGADDSLAALVKALEGSRNQTRPAPAVKSLDLNLISSPESVSPIEDDRSTRQAQSCRPTSGSTALHTQHATRHNHYSHVSERWAPEPRSTSFMKVQTVASGISSALMSPLRLLTRGTSTQGLQFAGSRPGVLRIGSARLRSLIPWSSHSVTTDDLVMRHTFGGSVPGRDGGFLKTSDGSSSRVAMGASGGAGIPLPSSMQPGVPADGGVGSGGGPPQPGPGPGSGPDITAAGGVVVVVVDGHGVPAMTTTVGQSLASSCFQVEAQDEGATLVFRGLRVRIGCHSGLMEEDYHFNKAANRMFYSGPAHKLTKAVSDAACGGMVLLSESCQQQLRTDELAAVGMILHMGDHQLTKKQEIVSLLQLVGRQLMGRLPLLPPPTSACSHSLGVLDAAAGKVTIAFMHVIGESSLMSWNQAIATQCFHRFQTRAGALLSKHGGYLVEGGNGFILASFPRSTSTVRWALQCVTDMKRVNWPEELLGHELGEELVNSSVDPLTGKITESIVLRGLRLKAGLDCGRLRGEVSCVTGRMVYRGRYMNRAARIASAAGTGQVLVSADVYAACSSGHFAHQYTATSLGMHRFKGVEQMELFDVRPRENGSRVTARRSSAAMLMAANASTTSSGGLRRTSSVAGRVSGHRTSNNLCSPTSNRAPISRRASRLSYLSMQASASAAGHTSASVGGAGHAGSGGASGRMYAGSVSAHTSRNNSCREANSSEALSNTHNMRRSLLLMGGGSIRHGSMMSYRSQGSFVPSTCASPRHSTVGLGSEQDHSSMSLAMTMSGIYSVPSCSLPHASNASQPSASAYNHMSRGQSSQSGYASLKNVPPPPPLSSLVHGHRESGAQYKHVGPQGDEVHADPPFQKSPPKMAAAPVPYKDTTTTCASPASPASPPADVAVQGSLDGRMDTSPPGNTTCATVPADLACRSVPQDGLQCSSWQLVSTASMTCSPLMCQPDNNHNNRVSGDIHQAHGPEADVTNLTHGVHHTTTALHFLHNRSTARVGVASAASHQRPASSPAPCVPPLAPDVGVDTRGDRAHQRTVYGNQLSIACPKDASCVQFGVHPGSEPSTARAAGDGHHEPGTHSINHAVGCQTPPPTNSNRHELGAFTLSSPDAVAAVPHARQQASRLPPAAPVAFGSKSLPRTTNRVMRQSLDDFRRGPPLFDKLEHASRSSEGHRVRQAHSATAASVGCKEFAQRNGNHAGQHNDRQHLSSKLSHGVVLPAWNAPMYQINNAARAFLAAYTTNAPFPHFHTHSGAAASDAYTDGQHAHAREADVASIRPVFSGTFTPASHVPSKVADAGVSCPTRSVGSSGKFTVTRRDGGQASGKHNLLSSFVEALTSHEHSTNIAAAGVPEGKLSRSHKFKPAASKANLLIAHGDEDDSDAMDSEEYEELAAAEAQQHAQHAQHDAGQLVPGVASCVARRLSLQGCQEAASRPARRVAFDRNPGALSVDATPADSNNMQSLKKTGKILLRSVVDRLLKHKSVRSLASIMNSAAGDKMDNPTQAAAAGATGNRGRHHSSPLAHQPSSPEVVTRDDHVINSTTMPLNRAACEGISNSIKAEQFQTHHHHQCIFPQTSDIRGPLHRSSTFSPSHGQDEARPPGWEHFETADSVRQRHPTHQHIDSATTGLSHAHESHGSGHDAHAANHEQGKPGTEMLLRGSERRVKNTVSLDGYGQHTDDLMLQLHQGRHDAAATRQGMQMSGWIASGDDRGVLSSNSVQASKGMPQGRWYDIEAGITE